MQKVTLEIVVPIYNEGKKVIKLLEQFQIIIKTQFRVLLCYDLEDDDIFDYKDSFKKFNFKVLLVKNSLKGPCSAVKAVFNYGNSDSIIV